LSRDWIERLALVLKPDSGRVLLRRFSHDEPGRTRRIVDRVLDMHDDDVAPLLAEVLAEFRTRHLRLRELFIDRFEEVCFLTDVSVERQMLIGAFFLAEYAIESAALFNPSIVADPDQRGVAQGALRFILSLRATGEGHISSITFRGGMLHADGRLEVYAAGGYLTEPRQIPNARYEKPLCARKLDELGLTSDFAHAVLASLDNYFTLPELRRSIDAELEHNEDRNAALGIWMLAKSNYEVKFEASQKLAERVLFPSTPAQRNGIEDARFVRFQNDNGEHTYFATITAFDGRMVLPELVETSDFLSFRFLTLNGPAATNKGMALFPRKIHGRFAMLGRQDSESISLMYSDNVHFWDERQTLAAPEQLWELVQLGNCGSPIETDVGWLVLTHGVGPMRKYSIGAMLLDLNDPSRVIARLREPLLQPVEQEREGYVPNVVYSCGALLHNGQLILPYGMADHATGFARVGLLPLLAAMDPV
jgi:predicted GH43/DUF377 family glycosyl hydrolase